MPSPSSDARHCLAWAIKESLVAYVRRTADGQVWVGPDVGVNANGEFLFPFDVDASGMAGRSPTAFRGEVALTAHGGMLRLLFADPRLEVDGTLSVRTAAVDPGNPMTRVRVARLAASDAAVAAVAASDPFGSISCTLTAEGSALFAGMYVEGIDLAPIAVNLPSPSSGGLRS